MLKQLYRFLSPRFQTLFLEYPVHFKPRYGHGHTAHPQLNQLIEKQRATYESFSDLIIGYKEFLWQIKPSGQETDTKRPVWNNGFLPGLDIAAIYTMMSHYRPSLYVEIGSGNSTKVAYLAKGDQQLNTRIVSIDPQPRAEIDSLADQVIRQPFENCSFDVVEELNSNDILFIDNSHRILPNSDAMVFFMEILPRLKPGVIVHIHDVYLPFDYPQFMCDRFYSEQYGLAFYLLANPDKYQVLFPNYFVSEDPALSKRLIPLWQHPHLENVEQHGGSFWIRIGH